MFHPRHVLLAAALLMATFVPNAAAGAIGITSAPPAVGDTPNATIEFTHVEPVSFTCRFVPYAPAPATTAVPCGGPAAVSGSVSYPDLPGGSFTVIIQALTATGIVTGEQRVQWMNTNMTDKADYLLGLQTGEVRRMLGGDDTAIGRGGADQIWAGAGRDNVSGGRGADKLHGDAGDDDVRGGEDNDTVWGDAGQDNVFGEEGNDVLWGGAGKDIVSGGPGTDTIRAGAGNDLIDAFDHRGRAGSEVIDCGPGKDKVWADPVDKVVGCETVIRTAPPANWSSTPGYGPPPIKPTKPTQPVNTDESEG